VRLNLRDRPAAATPGGAPADLSAAGLDVLLAELRRRGFEAFPAGAWEDTTARLRRRAISAEIALSSMAAKARATERAMRQGEDLASLVEEMGRIAGEEFPRAVASLDAAYIENRTLRDRASRAEDDASRLALALVGGEIDELERGEGTP
jgi:hypothetical protein